MAEEVLTVARMSAKDETAAAFNSVQRNINNTRKATGQLNQQFRFMRGGLGQVGHQVQDIAVQLQMGTNAMIVFGQQGSQIASLFGPQGAMIGAVLAVGAAIGVSFMSDVKKGENALKDLEQSILDTINRTNELGTTFRATLIAIYETQVENLTEKLEKQREEQQSANEKIAEHTRLTNQAANAERSRLGEMGKIEDRTRAARINTEDLARETDLAAGAILDFENKIAKLNKRLEQLRKGEIPDDLKEGANEATKSFESFVSSLDKATISTVGGQVAAKAYELSLLGLEGAQLDVALAALSRYEQSLLDAQADKEAAKAAKDRAAAERAMFEQAQEAIMQQDALRVREEEAERKRRQSQIDRLRTFEEFRNELGDTFMQMKKLEDGLVGVTERGMANFTNSFYDAISGAKSFKDAFHDMARSIVADLSKMLIQYYITQRIFGAITGMFSGGGSSVNANTPTGIPFGPAGGMPSGNFQGGGFTGYGSRSGGLDGKGGFAAILHPNETVIDHTMGGQAGVTIVQNINVTTGVQQTVRAEIANLLPQISNAAKSAVADARMRGGSFSRAMVGM